MRTDISAPDRKRRRVSFFHRHIANPITRRLPTQVLLETTGRISGRPRRTPIGGRLDGTAFWLVSDHGGTSDYIQNIQANSRVRVRIRGRWRTGTAHPLPDDDALARLATLPRFNSSLVRALGTDLLTVRIDLDPVP
ncbi:nitroreductase/quinone reductase family protein [Mycobacterium shigaense]|uniref:nitroreductase/quinone reductase family protein n=1 Tax=Mycobacterium shigaense TaxID=722731 RepID=UPI000BBB00A3|nr:nitroreductase/quinone reductase family protein [Mycobacterium shigaense]MEA1120416.1 nitroreductase/quinone reductase family protein [Mycobacterium shigaense]PRI14339.1 nitroreductase [Mycobacterium shigaense]